jgi:hypothetical protein
MRAFHLDSNMKTMGGVFYPTGWMVLMFPGEREARHAAKILADHGMDDGDLMLVTPEDFRREFLDVTGDDEMLPSAGTEGDTVRRFAELAAQGHHAVMVHAPDHKQSEHVMELLRDCPISYGQKYRKLVIEDVENASAPR